MWTRKNFPLEFWPLGSILFSSLTDDVVANVDLCRKTSSFLKFKKQSSACNESSINLDLTLRTDFLKDVLFCALQVAQSIRSDRRAL